MRSKRIRPVLNEEFAIKIFTDACGRRTVEIRNSNLVWTAPASFRGKVTGPILKAVELVHPPELVSED